MLFVLLVVCFVFLLVLFLLLPPSSFLLLLFFLLLLRVALFRRLFARPLRPLEEPLPTMMIRGATQDSQRVREVHRRTEDFA